MAELLLYFKQPYLLLIGLTPLFLILFSKFASKLSINQYCDKALQPWVISNSNKKLSQRLIDGKTIPIITWLLFCIALSGPRIIKDERSFDNNVKYNNAIVFVLDISKSMLSQDVYPDRITKAKLIIEKTLALTKKNLFSLVVYANNAHIAIPLTYDDNIILNILPSIRPNMLPVEGSQYLSGLKLADKQLTDSKIQNKLIVLVSDGDFMDEEKNNSLQIVSVDAPVTTIGVGTLDGQSIPAKDGSWLTFKNKPIKSRLVETKLKAIAEKFNGQYIRIKGDIKQSDIKKIISSDNIAEIEHTEKTIIVWQQVYHWFLVPSLLLFYLSTLRYKIIRKSEKFYKNITTDKGKISCLLLIIVSSSFFLTNEVKANDLEMANTQYSNNNYIKSEALYKKLDGYRGFIGQANSVYKQKNYAKALHLYNKSIHSATTDKQRASALFNLANTYYIIGDYEQAISIYQDVLLYEPHQTKAKINLQYAITINENVKRAIALRNGKTGGTKPGTGPKSAKIEDGTEIENSKVTLSSDEDEQAQALYDLPISNKLLNKLIQRGITHSIISSPKIYDNRTNSQWKYDHTTIDMVEILVKQEKIDDFNLWKRLFEIEEGFPAPVIEPHTKDGVNPW